MWEREVLSHPQAAAAANAAVAIGKVRHLLLQEEAPDRTVPAFVPPRPAGITPLSLSSWRAVMAWGYNISFGLVAFVLLVSLVLGAQQSNSSAERLRASGMTLEEWWRAVSLAFTWTCFQSFVLRHSCNLLLELVPQLEGRTLLPDYDWLRPHRQWAAPGKEHA